MKVQYTEVKEISTTKEVPDHFAYDDSKRGRIVDILIGARRRENLYSDEKHVVEGAISELTEAYSKATEILTIFCEAAK